MSKFFYQKNAISAIFCMLKAFFSRLPLKILRYRRFKMNYRLGRWMDEFQHTSMQTQPVKRAICIAMTVLPVTHNRMTY